MKSKLDKPPRPFKTWKELANSISIDNFEGEDYFFKKVVVQEPIVVYPTHYRSKLPRFSALNQQVFTVGTILQQAIFESKDLIADFEKDLDQCRLDEDDLNYIAYALQMYRPSVRAQVVYNKVKMLIDFTKALDRKQKRRR